jgi:hypothetical protein
MTKRKTKKSMNATMLKLKLSILMSKQATANYGNDDDGNDKN